MFDGRISYNVGYHLFARLVSCSMPTCPRTACPRVLFLHQNFSKWGLRLFVKLLDHTKPLLCSSMDLGTMVKDGASSWAISFQKLEWKLFVQTHRSPQLAQTEGWKCRAGSTSSHSMKRFCLTNPKIRQKKSSKVAAKWKMSFEKNADILIVSMCLLAASARAGVLRFMLDCLLSFRLAESFRAVAGQQDGH